MSTANENGLNRISLRVPSDLFDRLDKKRFDDRTTFQDIGLGLVFVVGADVNDFHRQLLAFLGRELAGTAFCISPSQI